MRLSRRTLFFLALAAICLVMVIPTPEAYRWVDFAAAGLAIFWAVLLGVEDIAARRPKGPGAPPSGMSAED
jgi:hypothetical protein